MPWDSDNKEHWFYIKGGPYGTSIVATIYRQKERHEGEMKYHARVWVPKDPARPIHVYYNGNLKDTKRTVNVLTTALYPKEVQ